jgi:hypothetical protein
MDARGDDAKGVCEAMICLLGSELGGMRRLKQLLVRHLTRLYAVNKPGWTGYWSVWDQNLARRLSKRSVRRYGALGCW